MKSLNTIVLLAGLGIALCVIAAIKPQAENPSLTYAAIHASMPKVKQPPCVEMYYSLKKHAKDNGIPFKYALAIAYLETGYAGPLHWNYNPALGSDAGAVGAMQIMPQFAQYFVPERKITREELKHTIDLNVMVSMRILKKLKGMHGDWKLVFGAYNTGSPCVNGYAERVYNFVPAKKTLIKA
jgi:soluble lytic murein transglycosylase-like protein